MKGKHIPENGKGWETVNLKVIKAQGTLWVHMHVNVCACTRVCVHLWFCSTSFLRSLFFFFLSFRTQEQEGHTQQLRKQETSTLKLKNKNMKTESIFCVFLCNLFPLNFPEKIHTLCMIGNGSAWISLCNESSVIQAVSFLQTYWLLWRIFLLWVTFQKH